MCHMAQCRSCAQAGCIHGARRNGRAAVHDLRLGAAARKQQLQAQQQRVDTHLIQRTNVVRANEKNIVVAAMLPRTWHDGRCFSKAARRRDRTGQPEARSHARRRRHWHLLKGGASPRLGLVDGARLQIASACGATAARAAVRPG
jgi:hypothetical protein